MCIHVETGFDGAGCYVCVKYIAPFVDSMHVSN